MPRHMLAPLAQIGAALGRLPPTFFLAAYLLSIPAFAGIYSLLPYGFYHSTVAYERAYARELRIAQELVERSLVRSLTLAYGDSLRIGTGVRVAQDRQETRPRVLYFRVDHDKYRALLYFFIYTDSVTGRGNTISVSFRPQPSLYTASSTYYHLDVIADSNPYFDSGSFSLDLWDKLLPLHARYARQGNFVRGSAPSNVPGPRNIGYLLLRPTEGQFLTELINASAGLPAEAAGSYGRMLYLSAVTITTLGYGDIVPITDEARLVTALEAVWGIVLIGLFLNALAYEVARRRDFRERE
jgi:hypothetical protein